MKLLERIFGRRLDDDPSEATKPDELIAQAVKHEATLRAVNDVLSDSQARVAVAIDETADLIARRRRLR